MGYFIKTPDGDIVEIETRKSVMEYLGCSLGFFSRKKYKKYDLIKVEKINR